MDFIFLFQVGCAVAFGIGMSLLVIAVMLGEE
jgi:hypothetical protein